MRWLIYYDMRKRCMVRFLLIWINFVYSIRLSVCTGIRGLIRFLSLITALLSKQGIT